MNQHANQMGSSFLLFRNLPPAEHLDQDLVNMADVMAARLPGTSDIPAGYTYFGQMVAHDMSRLSDSQFAPRPASPSLDLDSLYGDGFYDPRVFLDRTTGKFGIGKTYPKGASEDLPRDGCGIPRIPDLRNDDNLLLGQMHLAWMNIHNDFCDKVRYLPAQDAFESARKNTIILFQYLVLNDFLNQICHPDVYQYIVKEDNAFLLSSLVGQRAAIPLEVALAGFRFGHSMVRSNYALSTGSFSLSKILAHTGSRGLAGLPRLSDDAAVDWRLFFNTGRKSALNKAKFISPSVSHHLAHLDAIADPLALRNLRRGLSMGLPSGQAVATEVRRLMLEQNPELGEKINVFESADFADGKYFEPRDKKVEMKLLKKRTMKDNIPLWYYLLAEDWLDNPNQSDRGNQLGMVGSLLVAETLVSVAKGSKYSLYSEAGQERLAMVRRHYPHDLRLEKVIR